MDVFPAEIWLHIGRDVSIAKALSETCRGLRDLFHAHYKTHAIILRLDPVPLRAWKKVDFTFSKFIDEFDDPEIEYQEFRSLANKQHNLTGLLWEATTKVIFESIGFDGTITDLKRLWIKGWRELTVDISNFRSTQALTVLDSDITCTKPTNGHDLVLSGSCPETNVGTFESIHVHAVSNLGLEVVSETTNLDVICCSIVEPMPTLSHLSRIHLACCDVQDVSSLYGIPEVNLYRCDRIDDVSPLAQATCLKLTLCHGITDVSCLNGIRDLTIEDCRSVQSLKGIGTHNRLCLWNLNIKGPVQTTAKHVSLRSSNIKDISGIIRPDYLDISYTNVESLSGLFSVQTLIMEGLSGVDLTGLKVRHLNISFCKDLILPSTLHAESLIARKTTTQRPRLPPYSYCLWEP